jgi:pyruvate/2-oxoglutarate dehydrogenase complex dihydrolipoamide dehydrogenase (E3) component
MGVTREFDVIVLGGGAAGENIAGRCSGAGLSVVLVERALVGGECSYWACIPSKTLLRAGEAVASARRVPGARSAVVGDLDVAEALGWRDEMVGDYNDGSQVRWLEGTGATLVRGQGRLAGERVVDVELPEGGRERLAARRAVVVATGSRNIVPPIEGLSDIDFWDNKRATGAKEAPRRLLVLGGGAVGVEMAQAWRRLGSEEVTLVQRGSRLLTREEPFAGRELADAFAREGIEVLTGAEMTAVDRPSGDGPVTATLSGRGDIVADELLVAVGRRPATDDLGLGSVGLPDGEPIDVDETLRATSIGSGWLYAVGDVNGKALLTHMGKYQARIASDHIAGKRARDVADACGAPRVIFTDPQVAAVGLTEAEARARGIDVRTVRQKTGEVAGSTVSGKGLGGTSHIVVDRARRVVVGATFTGHGTGELLHSATIAVVAGVPLDVMWHAVPSFPTVSEVWLRLLEAYGL